MQKSGYCINGKVNEILKRFNNCDMQILSALESSDLWLPCWQVIDITRTGKNERNSSLFRFQYSELASYNELQTIQKGAHVMRVFVP